MIRKVYIDFIRDKLSRLEFRWLSSRGLQYVLTHASYRAGRTFCGPVLGTVVTNYSCNYRCTMCDMPGRDRELRDRGLGELGTAEMRGVLRDFAELGTSGIGFTGGEPLLREDIFDLLAYAKNLGMISHLNTNGFHLDERNVRRIFEARVDSINISLDGACAGTHDAIRGHRGAYDRAIAGIRRIIAVRDRGSFPLRVKTVTVLQESNAGEVEELVRLAGELSVDCVEFIPRQSFAGGNDSPAVEDASFLEKVDEITDYLIRRGSNGIRIENSATHLRMFRRSFSNADSPLKCYAGYNSCTVDCYGEVYPCLPWCNWRRSAGNVGEDGLARFWRSPAYNEIRREVSECRRCYLNCQAELNILFNPLVR